MESLKTVSNNRLLNEIAVVITTAIAILYFYIAIEHYHIDFGSVFVFLLTLLLSVQLPGLLYLKISGVKLHNGAAQLAVSFFMGVAVLTFVYYLSIYFDIVWILYVYSSVLSVAYILVKIRELVMQGGNKAAGFFYGESFLTRILFFFIVFMGCVLFLQFQEVSVQHVVSVDLYPDLVWHMGIVNAISTDFFPVVPWCASGMELKYHFFTDLLFGIIKRMTGLSADVIVLQCSSYLTAYVYTVSTYAFYKMVTKKATVAVSFGLLMIPAFFSESNFIYHVLSNVNNVAMAICCVMCFIIIADYGSRSGSKAVVLCVAFFIYLITGFKSPFAAVVVAALIGTCVFMLITRNGSKCLSVYTLVSTITFVVTYSIFIMKESSGSGVTRGASLVLGTTMQYSDFADIYYGFVNSDGAMSLLRYGVLFIYALIMLGVFTIPGAITFLGAVKSIFVEKKKVDWILVFNFAVVIVGVLAWLLLSFESNNQMYFAFAGIPSMGYITAYYFMNGMDVKRFSGKVVIAITVCLLFLGINSSAQVASEYKTSLLVEFVSSVSKEYKHDKKRFSNQEYQGMIWLRENTDKGDLIAGDRYSLYDKSTYNTEDRFLSKWFYYTAFSERTFYFEGTAYGGTKKPEDRQIMYENNELLYSENAEVRTAQSEELGVKFIVVSKRLYDVAPDLHCEAMKLCYSNADMDIYEVQL